MRWAVAPGYAATTMNKLMKTLLFLGLIFFVPTLNQPYLWGFWPMLTAMVAGLVLNLSQPDFKLFSKEHSQDGHSVTVLLVAGILIFLIPVLDMAFGRKVYPPLLHPTSLLGLALVFFGLGFRVYSISHLGKYFTSEVQILGDHQIIQTGPYKHLRHPSYTGAFIMSIGIALIFRSYAALLFCFLGFFPAYLYRIHNEEKALIQKFGEKYENYKTKTKGLIPFIC